MDKEEEEEKEKKLSIIFHLFVIEFTLVKHKSECERRLISFGQYRKKKRIGGVHSGTTCLA
jgi:hypothetical protein